MKAAYLTERSQVEIREFETPVLGEHDVLLQVKAAGICGSDIHAFHGTHPFRKPPMTLGHEVAGKVIAVGSAVKRVRAGERVTVEPQVFCGHCSSCQNGLFNLCLTRKTPGIGKWLGTFAEYFVAPEQQVYALPESLDYSVGSLAEPLAVGVHAVRIAHLEKGFTAVVLGTGPIGLFAAVAAQEAGASKVFCTDVNHYRLKLAEQFGLRSIQVESASVEEMIQAETQDGCDLAIVTVSSPKVVDQALRLVRRGGKVVVISVFGDPIPFNMSLVQLHEIDVKGAMVYTPDDTVKSLEILEKRREEFQKAVTHHVGLEQINEAFHLLADLQNEAMKIVVQP